MQRSVLRASSLLLYAAVAAIGEALVARPALLFLRGLGLFHTVLPWRVPFGALQLVLALGIASCALLLGARVVQRRPRLKLHATLLALLALSLGVRGVAEDPRQPADPLPALLTGLQTAASAVERSFASGGPPANERSVAGHLDTAAIDAELALLDPPGFVRFGLRRPMRAVVSVCVDCGPEPIVSEELALALGMREPGVIYISVPRGARQAGLSVRTSHGFATLPDGKPATIEVRGGTHTVPGRDPLMPAYPGMRSISDPHAQPP